MHNWALLVNFIHTHQYNLHGISFQLSMRWIYYAYRSMFQFKFFSYESDFEFLRYMYYRNGTSFHYFYRLLWTISWWKREIAARRVLWKTLGIYDSEYFLPEPNSMSSQWYQTQASLFHLIRTKSFPYQWKELKLDILFRLVSCLSLSFSAWACAHLRAHARLFIYSFAPFLYSSSRQRIQHKREEMRSSNWKML